MIGRETFAMVRKLFAAAGVLLIAGCISFGGGKAPAKLMRLTSDAPVPTGNTVTATLATTIIVAEPQTDRTLSVTRVPVQVDDNSVAYLKDAAWAELPTRLFRGLLAETIRASSKHLVLEDDQAARAGWRLSGRLLAMGYDARSHAAVVRYDALLVRGDGTLTSRRFEATEPNVAPTAVAAGPAINRAANSVAKAVADWVG